MIDTARELDSLLKELQALEDDSTDTDDLLKDKKWTFDAATSFSGRNVKDGVDLSGSSPVMTGYVSLSHDNGLMLDLGFTRVLGSDGYLQSKYLSLSYNYSAVDWFSVGLNYTKSKYDDNDSTTALAGASNLLSIAFDLIPTDYLIIDLDYDRYFGTDIVNFYSINMFSLHRLLGFRISPLVSLGWSSYTVEESRLRKTIRGGTAEFINNKTGFSSLLLSVQFYYKIFDYLTINASPNYIMTTETSLSGKSSQFYGKIGIKYSLDF